MRSRLLKRVAWILAVLAAIYVTLCAGLYVVLLQKPAVIARVMDRMPIVFWMTLPMRRLWIHANRGPLHVGDAAPDFDLPTLDHRSRIKLSGLRGGKPVVLVFGSYTCPPFRKRMQALLDVYQRRHAQADFYFIYIQEAHATDSWPADDNEAAAIRYAMPRSEGERVTVATVCSRELKIPFPMLVDSMDNQVDRAYAAWPIRLYVVDPAGRITYKSDTGPFGFDPEQLEAALGAARS